MIFSFALALAASQSAPPTATGPQLEAPALAAALAGTTGAVVALVDGETVTVGDLTKNLKLGNVRSSPGTPLVAHSDHLPYTVMFAVGKYRKPSPRTEPRVAPFPADALAGGTVTLKSADGKGFRLQSVKDAKWALPLFISPAFTDQGIGGLVIAANVEKLSELDFLRAVAKAVGGRFRQTGKEYRIEPNGSELRARAVRSVDIARANPTIPTDGSMNPSDVSEDEEVNVRPGRGNRTAPKVSDAGVKARLDLAKDAIGMVLPEQLEAFFEGRQGSLLLNLYGSQTLQRDLLRILESDAGNPGEMARIRRVVSSVPASNPGNVEIGLGFTINANLNLQAGPRLRTTTIKAL